MERLKRRRSQRGQHSRTGILRPLGRAGKVSSIGVTRTAEGDGPSNVGRDLGFEASSAVVAAFMLH